MFIKKKIKLKVTRNGLPVSHSFNKHPLKVKIWFKKREFENDYFGGVPWK